MNIEEELHFLRNDIKELKDVLLQMAHNQHQTVAAPVITNTSGTISIACATTGAAIHYTTDGTEPTIESEAYSDAFEVEESCTVKAFAVKLDMNDSATASLAVEIEPEPEPEGDGE